MVNILKEQNNLPVVPSETGRCVFNNAFTIHLDYDSVFGQLELI